MKFARLIVVLLALTLTNFLSAATKTATCSIFRTERVTLSQSALWDFLPSGNEFTTGGIHFEMTDRSRGRVRINEINASEPLTGFVERELWKLPDGKYKILFNSARLLEVNSASSRRRSGFDAWEFLMGAPPTLPLRAVENPLPLLEPRRRIPSWVKINELQDLVSGKGWPTILIASLFSLKSLGLKFGGAHHAGTTLTNQGLDKEIAEILGIDPDDSTFDYRTIAPETWQWAVQQTSPYRYLTSILYYSGHQIEAVRIQSRRRMIGEGARGSLINAHIPDFMVDWDLSQTAR